jgi:hypothetical protein
MTKAEKASRKGPPRRIPLHENPEGALDISEESRLRVMRLLQQIDRLALKIDVAFGGEPFLPGLSPTCPANRRRFEAFLDEQIRVARLIHQLRDLYRVNCAPKEEDRSSDRGNEPKSKTAGREPQ